MIDVRNEIRLEKKLLVNIGQEGLETMGLTANISRTGLSFTATETFALDTEVLILIGIADETFTLKGMVVWSQPGSDSASGDTQVVTGVKITDAPEKYTQYVQKLAASN